VCSSDLFATVGCGGRPVAKPKPKPSVETPLPPDKGEEPKAETPKGEEPKAEEPKADTPKAEMPKADTPKAE
jgi:hypothetical protein